MDRHPTLYERDYYAWTQDQAARLRNAAAERLNLDIDFENLAGEVEDMGRGHLRAAESALARVIEHLLKLEFSPAADPRRVWRASVQIHRRHARDELDDSPSLGRRVRLEKVYGDALLLPEESFAKHHEEAAELPPDCPYTLDQILDEDFEPANRHGLTD